jgi:hypothetical protein
MSYDQHDRFRDRLNALPLSAGRRGIAAMVLVEIVRWISGEGLLCAKTAGELGDLLNLRPGDVAIALRALESVGVIEMVEPSRPGTAAGIRLKALLPEISAEQLDTEIGEAIRCHAMWKRRLRHAIDTGAIDTGAIDIALGEVARDDACEFGRWLCGPSFPEVQRDDDWHTVYEFHAQFHRVAAATLQLALAGRKDEAAHAMGPGGLYSRASLRLSKALSGWRHGHAK